MTRLKQIGIAVLALAAVGLGKVAYAALSEQNAAGVNSTPILGVGGSDGLLHAPAVGVVGNMNTVAPIPNADGQQDVGTDGGHASTLSTFAGACMRVLFKGTWNVRSGAFELFSDGGPVVNFATGALYTLPDGGAITHEDGGTVYPDGGGGLALGGLVVYPKLFAVLDGSEKQWCLPGSTSKISFVTIDGGTVVMTPLFP